LAANLHSNAANRVNWVPAFVPPRPQLKSGRGTNKLNERVELDGVRRRKDVRHSSPDGRSRLFVALIIAAAFTAAPASAAEIFKCVAKDGTALYQNFPCNIDSIGSVASSSPSVPPSDSTATKSNTAIVKVTSAARSGSVKEPRIGMSSDEVRTLWGEPEEMVDDEPAEGGRVSNWRYADGRTVQFDHKHRVLSVQR
jgi:hypothetical protein